jgi:RNA-directed DNA polymerase
MYSKKIKYYFEFYIHTLLFQIYAIESLAQNSGSKTCGIDGKILENNFISKFMLLQELKVFKNNKSLPLRRIYIPKVDHSMRPISIPTIKDRAVQQLFLLLLDPIIESHSDIYSFGFRKGRSQIMALGILQKGLQSKSVMDIRNIDTQYI